MPAPLSDPVAVRVPVDVLESVDAIASILDRKRSWVIVRALKNYLNDEGQYLLDIAAGRREAEAGDLVEGEALLRSLNNGVPLVAAKSR